MSIKERVKATHRKIDSYVSPHHQDGGWHGSTFASERFDADWQPLNHRILFRRLPDRHKSAVGIDQEGGWAERRAVVVKVGPGKRDEEGERVPLDAFPGDVVTIGKHVDWDSYDGLYCLAMFEDIQYFEMYAEENTDEANRICA